MEDKELFMFKKGPMWAVCMMMEKWGDFRNDKET